MELLRPPSLQLPPLTPLLGHRSIPKPGERHDLSSMFWISQLGKLKRPHLGGIVRCLNHLNFWRGSSSILRPSRLSMYLAKGESPGWEKYFWALHPFPAESYGGPDSHPRHSILSCKPIQCDYHPLGSAPQCLYQV